MVIGFEVVDMGRLTAAEFKNGYSDHYSEACFIAPGVIRLSTRVQPSAPLVAHECGHAVTMRAEWNAREREIDGLWATEGCANRYVMKWGFGEAALRRIVHSQIGHMGGVPGEVFHLGKRTYRVTRDFRYRAVGRRGHGLMAAKGTVANAARRRLQHRR